MRKYDLPIHILRYTLVLVLSMVAPADPILLARPAAYAVSYSRRLAN